MRLVHNWREIAVKAWSIRWIIAAAFFGAVELALPLFVERLPLPAFLILSTLCMVAALAARLMVQRNIPGSY